MQLNHTEKSNCSVFPTRVLFRKDRAVWIGVAEHIRSLNSTTRKTHRSATKAVPCLAAVDNGTPLFFRVSPPICPRTSRGIGNKLKSNKNFTHIPHHSQSVGRSRCWPAVRWLILSKYPQHTRYRRSAAYVPSPVPLLVCCHTERHSSLSLPVWEFVCSRERVVPLVPFASKRFSLFHVHGF